MTCITCNHDCHCDDSCEALPMEGGCGCNNCYHGEKMIKKLWQKIVEWLWK